MPARMISLAACPGACLQSPGICFCPHRPRAEPAHFPSLSRRARVALAGLSARSDSAITSRVAAWITLESPAATPEGFGSRRNRG